MGRLNLVGCGDGLLTVQVQVLPDLVLVEVTLAGTCSN